MSQHLFDVLVTIAVSKSVSTLHFALRCEGGPLHASQCTCDKIKLRLVVVSLSFFVHAHHLGEPQSQCCKR
jgi:hypothetical protein